MTLSCKRTTLFFRDHIHFGLGSRIVCARLHIKLRVGQKCCNFIYEWFIELHMVDLGSWVVNEPIVIVNNMGISCPILVCKDLLERGRVVLAMV